MDIVQRWGSSLREWAVKESAKSGESAPAELSLTSYTFPKKQRSVTAHELHSKIAHKYSALKSTRA